MNLSTIFAKPIDRPIEGVIKADDKAFLQLEVEEYVLTNEVAKRQLDRLDRVDASPVAKARPAPARKPDASAAGSQSRARGQLVVWVGAVLLVAGVLLAVVIGCIHLWQAQRGRVRR